MSMMHKYRIQLGLVILFALLLVAVAYGTWAWYGLDYCRSLDQPGPLSQAEIDCDAQYRITIFNPFYSGMLLKSLALSAFILLFFPAKVYWLWRWAALVFMVVAVGYIFSIPPYTDALLDKKAASDLMGYFLLGGTVVLAIVVTAYDWWRGRGASGKLGDLS